MAEKTEKPTDKKLRDSAQKGQSFKSKDLATTLSFLVGIFYISNVMSLDEIKALYSQVLINPDSFLIKPYITKLGLIFLSTVMPFILSVFLTGALITLLQTKFTIAFKALKINLKALNPVEGFKRIFSMRTVKELVKSILYLILFVFICYQCIHNELALVISTYQATLSQLIYVWINLSVKSILIFLLFSSFILLGDFLAEFFLHFKDLKMEKHEVKQEYKEQEGNPEIKGHRRQLHQDLLNGEEVVAVQKSTAIITNPTHIAICILYRPNLGPLPIILYKFKNAKAHAAKGYAKQLGKPIVTNIPVARYLYKNYSAYSIIDIKDPILLDVMDIILLLLQVELNKLNIEMPVIDDPQQNQSSLASKQPIEAEQSAATEQPPAVNDEK